MGLGKLTKAARFHKIAQPLAIEQVERPTISEEEVLLRTREAGICHTDLHLIDTGMMLNPPVTLGHEIAGVVEEVGSSVFNFKKGDRAVVHFWNPCGSCHYCLKGEEMLCLKLFARPSYGISCDGGYAEYCSVDPKRLVLVPENVPLDFAATLGCAGLTALHAIQNTGRNLEGASVVIYGLGGLGLYAIQFAKHLQMHVIAVGRSQEKLRLAEVLGADVVINASTEAVSSGVKAATRNRGADAIFSFVPFMDLEVLRNSLTALANGGRVVLVGLTSTLSVDLTPFIFRGFSLQGSFAGSKKELATVLDLASKERITSIVRKKMKLEEINEGLQSLKRGEVLGRCVVAP